MPNVIIPEHPSQNPLSTPNPFKPFFKARGGFNMKVKHYIKEDGESPLEKWLKKNRAAMG
ncbi:hypothetical protein D3C75_146820 [compost metagenome]